MRLAFALLALTACSSAESVRSVPPDAPATSPDATTEPDAHASTCGDGYCSPDEDGASCGADCCDEHTACSATRMNGGTQYCRSMNGGSPAWIDVAQANQACDGPGDINASVASCAGQMFCCTSTVGGWSAGACPCGDANCDLTDDCRNGHVDINDTAWQHACPAACADQCTIAGSGTWSECYGWCAD